MARKGTGLFFDICQVVLCCCGYHLIPRIPVGYSPVGLLPAVGPDVVVVVGRGGKALPAKVAGVRLFSFKRKVDI